MLFSWIYKLWFFFLRSNEKRKRKRKANEDDKDEDKEEQYAESVRQPEAKKKYLLPIKTSEGLVLRTENVEDDVKVEDGKAKIL